MVDAAVNEFENDPDIIVARVGIELEKYLSTPVGKSLVKRAELQIEEAVSKMLELDPDENRTAFRKHRMDALVAQQALTWLADILADGKQAEDSIHKQDEYQNN